jgi:trehalose synthase
MSAAIIGTARSPARTRLWEAPLGAASITRLRGYLTAPAYERLEDAHRQAAGALAGRAVWGINSTARGGGVAEMLRTLSPYWRGAGVDAHWLVLDAPPDFFRLTKRLHNLLHGVEVGRPGARDRELFAAVSREALAQAAAAVRPGDIVVLEDPQVAGLAAGLKRAGAIVVWRCHVGADQLTDPVAAAWAFLLEHIAPADAFVFTREAFVPPGIDERRVRLVLPAIDPCSTRNQPLPRQLAYAILDSTGLARATCRARLPRVPTARGLVRIRRRARAIRHGPPARLGADPLVVALARWDRLKDPVGIIESFAEHVHHPAARLIVAGAAVGAVADDPEGGDVLARTRASWRALALRDRRRIDVVSLPMNDVDENGLIVNALQRNAAVIVKKSVQEGFGLGVTEGLWKARPVVATRVGGHQEQIEHGRTGLLVDRGDAAGFGAAIDELLYDPELGRRLGAAGREHVRHRLLADRHFIDWMRVFIELTG